MIYKRSSTLFKQAQQVIPGGVNSPVRAFNAVGGTPIFAKRAKGAYIFDEDERRYIDYINSWGPMLLGHAFSACYRRHKKYRSTGHFLRYAYGA